MNRLNREIYSVFEDTRIFLISFAFTIREISTSNLSTNIMRIFNSFFLWLIVIYSTDDCTILYLLVFDLNRIRDWKESELVCQLFPATDENCFL